jgi:hypothetical protein
MRRGLAAFFKRSCHSPTAIIVAHFEYNDNGWWIRDPVTQDPVSRCHYTSWLVVWIISRSLIERLPLRHAIIIRSSSGPSWIEFDEISFSAGSCIGKKSNGVGVSSVPADPQVGIVRSNVQLWKRCRFHHHGRDLRYDQKHRRKLSFLVSVTMSVRDHCIRPGLS